MYFKYRTANSFYVALRSNIGSGPDSSQPSACSSFFLVCTRRPTGSDHFPVWIRYQENPVLGSRPRRWNFRHADWTRFQTTLEASLSVRADTSAISAEDFTTLLLDSAENLIAYRKARALARRTINEAKVDSWRNYISSLNRFTPTTQVWTRIKRISGRFSSSPLPVLRVNNSDIIHPFDVAEEIARSLSERCRGGATHRQSTRRQARREQQSVDFTTTEHKSYNEHHG